MFCTGLSTTARATSTLADPHLPIAVGSSNAPPNQGTPEVSLDVRVRNRFLLARTTEKIARAPCSRRACFFCFPQFNEGIWSKKSSFRAADTSL